MSKPLDPRLVKRVPALRRLMGTLVVLDVVLAALVVAQAVLLADAVALVFHGAGVAAVGNRVVAVIGIAAARGVLGGVQEWAGQRASVRARAQVRRLVLDSVIRLGPACSRRQSPGRLTNTTGPGLDGLDGYVTRAVPALVAAMVIPPAALLAITIADWQSGVILAVLLPLVPVFMALVGLTTNRLVQRQYAALERLTGQFLDLLRGLGTLRVYGRAEAQQQTLHRISDDYRRRTKSTLKIAFLSGLVLDLIAALSVAVVAVDIGLRLDHGHVTLATALVVLLLAPELFAPLRAVGAQHHASQEGGEAARAALDIVDEADALPAAPPPTTVPVGSGHVAVTDLTVRYPGRDTAALDSVSLTLRPGHIVALCGPSGAGKSTVLAVLQGVVAPDAGRVTVSRPGGSLDLADLDPEAWRAAVAWVPQRPRPTQPTVADEVRMGCPEADDDTVALACRLAAAPDPGTPLGEDGLGVSAGQRRRIALARVLVRAWAVCARGEVPLVLLDEPSEDLDRDTETVVATVLDDLRDWATVVIATHSDVLADQADELVLMADGHVLRREWQQPAPVAAIVDVLPDADPRRPVAARRGATPTPPRLRELVRAAGATRMLAGAVALSAAAVLTGLGLTSTSLWLIARAAQHPNVQALALAVVGVRTFAIGRAVLRYAERLLTHDVALRMLAALRGRVFAGLRTLSPAALSAYGRGDLLRRFVGDVDGAQEGLVRAAVPAGGAVAGAAGSIALAAALDLRAGLVLAAGLLLAAAIGPLAGRLAGDAAEVVRLAGARDRRVAGLVDGLDELVAYGRADHEVAAVAEADAAVTRAAARPAVAAAVGTAATGIVSATTLGLVLAAAASAATAGRLGVVNVGVLVICVLTGFEAVSTLPAALVAWRRCRAGLSRVAEVAARDAAPQPGTTPAPDGPTGLRGRALTLAPAAGAPAVLDGASLDVVAGRRVAVVGPSGCGKSTLLGAAVGQTPVASGRLDITGERPDGGSHEVPLDDVAHRASVIAGSLQGDHVFDATLRDNVRLVRPDASDAELDAVAERVRLLDVVQSLPRGWDTAAGADGSALSGGQRQRLLLARALLANPQILVLDEPTAHLDGATEAALLADLLDATAGRTVLLSSHRRLPAGGIDSVLSVQDGKLVAVGSSTSSVAPDA